MSKQEDRKKILDAVKEYTRKYHGASEYKEGDYIHYASRVYDEKELENLVDASLDFWLTAGRYTELFEKKLTDYLGVSYVSFVNSGSSANLLALSCLMSPLLQGRRINRNDEVICVACGFPTTINPVIQLGLVPVFLDITIPQYNIDINDLDKALTDRTKAVMIAHTMGNPFDIKAVKDFCDRNNLWLIEDNCDALGSRYDNQFTGTFGDIATSSFYPAHHITTGEGGAVYTSNPLLHKIVRSLRDWGRDCVCLPGRDNCCQKRFEGDYGLLPHGYDHKYVYSHFGYNLKATDLQAAIGVAQIDKLADFVKARKYNFEYLDNRLRQLRLDDELILPVAIKNSDPSWFGYIITTNKTTDSNALIRYLEDNNIQTRKLFAGNIIKHPCFDDIRDDNDRYRVIGNLENTDYVMEHSFWIGVYPGMKKEMLDYIVKKIAEFFNYDE